MSEILLLRYKKKIHIFSSTSEFKPYPVVDVAVIGGGADCSAGFADGGSLSSSGGGVAFTVHCASFCEARFFFPPRRPRFFALLCFSPAGDPWFSSPPASPVFFFLVDLFLFFPFPFRGFLFFSLPGRRT